MSDPVLDQIFQRQNAWLPLYQRQAKETYREVYKLDDQYVIKRFTLSADLRKFRKPWRIEHRALERLQKESTPRTYGWKEEITEGQRVVTYVREHVPGTVLTAFTPELIAAAAELFGCLHRNGVVTDDANVQNFIQDSSGELHFIDFGRARLLPPRSWRLYFHIGEEFAKFIREGLGWDRELWQLFKQAYYEKAGHGSLAGTLIQGSFFGHYRMRRLRKILSGRPAHS